MNNKIIQKIVFYIENKEFSPGEDFFMKLAKEFLWVEVHVWENGSFDKSAIYNEASTEYAFGNADSQQFEKYLHNSTLSLAGETLTLIVTDSQSIYEEYKDEIPVLILEHDKNRGQIFEGAQYFIEGFEDCDGAYFDGVFRRMKGYPWEIGHTGTIQVREMVVEDARAIHELYNPEEEILYTENLNQWGQKEEETREYLKTYIKNRYGIFGYGMWVIVDLKTMEVIGRVGFQDTDDENAVELGFLIKKEYRQRGITFEACKIALNYINENYPDFNVLCEIKKENLAAVGLARKLVENGYKIKINVK